MFFHMNDTKVYNGKDGTEVGKWRRVYTSPNASIDTKIDPFSRKQFVDKTGNKKGTLGDLWDRSAELSKERTEIAGHDEVKEKFLKDYKKDTGKEHFSTLGKTIEHNGFKVSFDPS